MSQCRSQEDENITPKARNAAAAYIISICANSETFIYTLQLEKAQAGLYKSSNLEQQYQLSDNNEVNDAIERLADLLNKGKCSLIQHDFNIQVGAAKKFVEKLDFTNAENALAKAKKYSEQSSECEIDIRELNELGNSIWGITTYSKQMGVIKNLIAKNETENAILAYIALTVYYKDSVTNNYGIEHKALFNFIVENNDNNLINYAVLFYTQNGEYENAIKLLNELYARNFISSWSKENQQKLGVQLANRDFEAAPDIDPKLKVSDYTNDLPWFNYLKTGYLKQWKNLLVN